MRNFIVGDIHGCLDELNMLVDAVGPVAGDRWFFVGDLVDRGPDSIGTVRRVRELLEQFPGSVAVAGNHEEKSLRLREKFQKTGEWGKRSEPWMWEAPADVWEFLDSLPLVHRIPECGLILVHGGFFPRFFDLYDEIGEPRDPWRRGGGKRMNRMRRFLRVRYVDEKGDMVALNDTDRAIHQHWSKVYDGREGFAVFGHDPQLTDVEFQPLVENHAAGIDTGCVFGGFLTAMVVASQENGSWSRNYVQVAAKKQYAEIIIFDD